MEGDETAANQYTYWLDENSLKKEGVYCLYRNKIEDGKSVYSNPYNMPVIAKGFTALLGKKFSFISEQVYIEVINEHGKGKVFNVYFHEQVNTVNRKYKDQPVILNENEIFIKAVEEHLKNEKLFFKESSSFYYENLLENEVLLKNKIKAYVENYLLWVSMKISNEKPKSDLNMKDCITEKKLNEITASLIIDNYISSDDEELFKNLFRGFSISQKVKWNPKNHGSKSSLFALVFNMTDLIWEDVKVSLIKKYFISTNPDDPILTKWKSTEQTKLIDKLFKKK